MGASRYFFSMSGVILLIGALAIGGRGLNLGIDFTSGTRITVALIKPADPGPGALGLLGGRRRGARPCRRSATRRWARTASRSPPRQLHQRADAIQVRVRAQQTLRRAQQPFNSTSVGPTFGRTVANSAVIAIIASLLVISAYVALRFEWKFAVPVLIALMHDLLITSGVYALTGREVTTDTVAALLTILGYSLYDTIIVFDRVRENIPRMPRAAFSQIVNRSMSEVLTRSMATTSCTLMPILALLLFGGSTLQDFAFALLIGVASGAYSSIFIASPVLTHWKERERGYRHRRERIEAEHGHVPPTRRPAPTSSRRVRARAGAGPADRARARDRVGGRVRADEARPRHRAGRAGRHTSTLTKRLAHTRRGGAGTGVRPSAGGTAPRGRAQRGRPRRRSRRPRPVPAAPTRRTRRPAPGERRRRRPPPSHYRRRCDGQTAPRASRRSCPRPTSPRTTAWPARPSRRPRRRSRNRRHGRRR